LDVGVIAYPFNDLSTIFIPLDPKKSMVLKRLIKGYTGVKVAVYKTELDIFI
jgi:hypothetical protein